MDKGNIKALIFLTGIYFFWNLVAGTMGFFMPYIYQKVGGLSNAHANLLQAFLWTIAVFSTYLVFIKYADKMNRKLLFAIGSFMGISAWSILTFGGMGIVELILFVILWGVSAGFSAQGFYALFASELFHTKYRGQAQGFMFCVVRVGVGLISLVVPIMIVQMGFSLAGMIMIFFLIISLIFGLLMIPETRGRSLRSIEEERYGKSANFN